MNFIKTMTMAMILAVTFANVQASSSSSSSGPEISKKAYLAKCSKDIKAHCSNIGTVERRVLKCLIKTSEVSKSCKRAAKKRQVK